ncbi:DUF4190 domain-containing protein [Streptomyces sp. KLOTTS4A1]|uniref:DUF4190 domain-containing protein n=1 Tax=Streptomyces sp. KLOTTS4A1 TaxID=3390996 RepID=UPI0039F5FCCC
MTFPPPQQARQPDEDFRAPGPYPNDPWVHGTSAPAPPVHGAYAGPPYGHLPGASGGPPLEPALNGLAVASLATALVLLAPLSVVFGIVALVQISRTGSRGKGLAIAGITISGVVISGVVALLLSGALNFRVWVQDGTGAPVRPDRPDVSRVHILTLREGDCFTPAELPGQNQERLADPTAERKPCTASHRGEVYATFDLPDKQAYPGVEQINETASRTCGELLFDYTPDVGEFSMLLTFFYYPQADRWALGDRTVRCWAGRPTGDLDRSVRQDIDALTAEQRAYVTALHPLYKTQARRPVKNPEADLAGARKWAREMATAQEETARLLKEAELPRAAKEKAGELAEAFEDGVPHWEAAARAEDAGAFRAAMKKSAVDPAVGVELERSIRETLGLQSLS